MSFRIGLGFDVHRLKPGRRLWLGGVEIPSETGLDGHSDADVLLHAISDAMLGAVAAGDLGEHFPPGDEKWRGVKSTNILQKVREIIEERGYGVANLDATIVAQEPRMAPYRDAMRSAIADILGLEKERVSVKATTTEGTGPEGRKESMSARAVVLLQRTGTSASDGEGGSP